MIEIFLMSLQKVRLGPNAEDTDLHLRQILVGEIVENPSFIGVSYSFLHFLLDEIMSIGDEHVLTRFENYSSTYKVGFT